VEKDLKKGIEVGMVAADRGYADGENHYFLEQKGIKSVIRIFALRKRIKIKRVG
jgi:hypothetical protein